MMVELLDPKEGETIYDPACGNGSMLLASIDHKKRNDGDLISPLGVVHHDCYRPPVPGPSGRWFLEPVGGNHIPLLFLFREAEVRFGSLTDSLRLPSECPLFVVE